MAREKRAERERNPKSSGVAGFTLGIVSIVMFIFSPLVGVVLSIVGFFLCLKQQRKEKTRAAKIGMILNVIGFIVNVAWWVISVEFVYPYLNQFYMQQLNGTITP